MDTDADPEASVENGARRATFLPSTAESRTAAAVDNSERFDDDVLAAAMADETARLGLTGAISIIALPTTPSSSRPVPLPPARSVATGLTPPAHADRRATLHSGRSRSAVRRRRDCACIFGLGHCNTRPVTGRTPRPLWSTGRARRRIGAGCEWDAASDSSLTS